MDVTALRHGRRLIAVVMGAPDWNVAVHDALALLHYGYDNTVNRTVVSAGTVLGTYRDLHLAPDHVALAVPLTLAVTVPLVAVTQLRTQVSYRAPVAAAVRKGEMLGLVRVLLGRRALASAPLLAQRSAASAGFFGTLWNRI
jgi:D-alanyl-D-alanine carboxypeptidase (penicillin-binding protein 5/6)